MKNFLFSMLIVLAFTTPVLAKNSIEITGIQTEKVLKSSSSLDRISNVSAFLCSFLVEVIDRDGNVIEKHEYVDGPENENECDKFGLETLNHFTEAYPNFTVRLTMYP